MGREVNNMFDMCDWCDRCDMRSVYIVKEITDQEYMGSEIRKVFDNFDKAYEYQQKHQYTFTNWYNKKEVYAFIIECWEVE